MQISDTIQNPFIENHMGKEALEFAFKQDLQWFLCTQRLQKAT